MNQDKQKQLKNKKNQEHTDKKEKKTRKIKPEKQEKYSDYDSDSSDEDLLVRTGNVPRKWYKDFDHVGYGIDSKKVDKQDEQDEVEKFLMKAKSKDWWRNITDEMNNKTVFLSDQDLAIIKRIRAGMYASTKVKDNDDYFEQNIPYQLYPLSNHMSSKKAFEPSHNEKKMINRLAKLIEDGLVKVEKEKKQADFFGDLADIWKFENSSSLAYHPGMGYTMPKPDAPDNDVSYNFNTDENTQISLRKIPKFDKLIEEQYDRLNDIYNSARVIRKKLDLNEKNILPEVPEPSELKPFPTKDNIINRAHKTSINALCIEASGDYLISGDMSGILYFSDIITSKVLLNVYLEDKIRSIQYNSFLCLVTCTCESGVYFFRPKFLERKNNNPGLLNNTIIPAIQAKVIEQENIDSKDDKKELYYWKVYDNSKKSKTGLLFSLHKHNGDISSVSWHNKGDFFSVLGKNELGKSQVHIHSLSSLQYFSPSSKNKGDIRSVSFHPTKPHFFVSADSNVMIYDLKQQELIRKFVSNLYPIINICLHPMGSDFVAGSLGGKVAWFQSDLSEKPYLQMEQYHETKIKSLTFHKHYNLLSSASKEGKVLLYYSKVYDDFIKDPLIVPLTTLKSFYKNPMGEVNATEFHPRYPWIITAGSNKLLSIWS